MHRTTLFTLLFSASFTLFYLPLITEPLSAQEKSIAVREAKESAARTWALLIGINKFSNPKIPPLYFCESDAAGLAEALEKAGVPKDNITLMTNDAEDIAKRPSGQNIRTQIELITGIASERDNLILSISTHGVENEKNKKTYYAANDCDLDKEETFVNREWIYEKIKASKARKKLFIGDACREKLELNFKNISGGLKSMADPLGDTESMGYAFLVSCSPGQYSIDEKELKHGVFTYYILEGFAGKADSNSDGVITFEELYQYSHENTKRWVLKEYRRLQVPMRGGEYSGDFVIGVVPKPQRFNERDSVNPVVPPRTNNPPMLKPQDTSSSPRKAGDLFELTIKDVKYRFHWCPAGEFLMGSPSGEKDRYDNETQRQVTLTQGFWMLETEVTQEMWESVMGENPSEFKGATLPVEQVSWDDCQKFIEKINTLAAENLLPQGFRFSLPTESQWEYACRAGTATPFSFGSVLNGDKANCNGNYPYGTATKGKYLGKTVAVGSYSANVWGLYDMHGNVWEWCSDWYGRDYPTGSATDPTGATSGSLRVLRGGGWYGNALGCRSAYRDVSVPSYRYNSLGLRLSLVSESK